MKLKSLSPEWRQAFPESTIKPASRRITKSRVSRADLFGLALLVAVSIALIPAASRATNRQQLWITPSESQLR